MRLKKIVKPFLSAALSVSLLAAPFQAYAFENVTPTTIDATLKPEESKNFDVNVKTNEQPIPQLDVAFAIDLTGSMGDELKVAKSKSIEIMKNVKGLVSDSSFSVVSFMDYQGSYKYDGYSSSYGSSVDKPFILNQENTDDVTKIEAAINSLTLGDGSDIPEDYTRVLYELAQGTNEWRPYAKKVVIMIGDAPTHDLNFAGYNFGGDPGRDGKAGTEDDLDFEKVVKELNDKNITVLAIQGDVGGDATATATFKGMSEGFSEAEGTKGQYFQLTNANEIPKVVADMVKKETSTIKKLNLEVPEKYKNWIKLDQEEYTEVGPNTTKTFKVTVTPPKGTANGTHKILLRALGDGAYLGSTELTVEVDSGSHQDPNAVVLDHLEASESSIFLGLKQSVNLKVYSVYSDGTTKEITMDKGTVYKSKSTSVVTVAKGIVKSASKEGTTSISVSYGGKSLTIPVTVAKKKIVSLEASASVVQLNVGESIDIDLHAVYEDGSIKDVTNLAYWMTDDSTVTQVDKGTIEGISAGTAIIKARYGGEEAFITTEVIDEEGSRELVGLEASDKNLKLLVGEEEEVSLWAVYDNGDKEEINDDIVWQSRKNSIASVDDGVITAKKVGKTTIVATYKGESISIAVEVTKPEVTSIIPSVKKITLSEGAEKQIKLKAVYDNGEKVDVTNDAVWKVKRDTIVEVENGLVQAVGKGSTTVTVSYEGKTASINITVK